MTKGKKNMHLFKKLIDKRKVGILFAFMATFLFVLAVHAQDGGASGREPVTGQRAPAGEPLASPLQLNESPRLLYNKLDPTLGELTGAQQLVIRLTEPAVGEAVVGAPSMDIGLQYAARAAAGRQQQGIMAGLSLLDPNVRILGQTSTVLNAVYVEMDVVAARELAKLSDVYSVSVARDYQLALSETVPYIGGTAVQKYGGRRHRDQGRRS